MRFAAIILLLLSASPVLAQSLAEESGLNALLGRAPTDTDVVLGIHQLDLFQLEVADTADMRGDDRLRSFAKAQSAVAEG